MIELQDSPNTIAPRKLPRGVITIGQAVTMRQVEMAEDRRHPLVTLDKTAPSGHAAFTFYDREIPGASYEFWCGSEHDALQWIQHMATKRWVTVRHLEWFAGLVLTAFPAVAREGRRRDD